MKLLIDESLQRDLAGVLAGHGHDAVHVVDVGLRGAPDVEVLSKARAEARSATVIYGPARQRLPVEFGARPGQVR